MSELDDLERAVALAELEHAVDLALLAAGFPPGTRPPTAVEISSRCDFAALEAALDTAADALTRAAAAAYADAIALLLTDLPPDLPGLLARLDDLDGPLTTRPLPGADTLVDELRTAAAGVLEQLADTGWTDTLAEARRAGLTALDAPLPDVGPTVDQVRAQAHRLATAPLATAVRTAREAAYRANSPDAGAVRDAIAALAEADPPAAVRDEAARAVNRVHGTARTAAQTELPAATVRWYASELLDRNTCTECSNVDGRDYDDHADALVDYPDGRFRYCKGGDRCRGTLVAIAASEAPVSPADRPAGPGPRTRRDDTPAVLDPTIR